MLLRTHPALALAALAALDLAGFRRDAALLHHGPAIKQAVSPSLAEQHAL